MRGKERTPDSERKRDNDTAEKDREEKPKIRR